MNEPTPRPQLDRRRFLGWGAAATGALALGGTVGLAIGAAGAKDDEGSGPHVVSFHGKHQAGIVTAQQDRLLFASFDLTTKERADVIALLDAWTTAVEELTIGAVVGKPTPNEQAPPQDTGEALGLDPARLTLTFGFGPGLFSRDGVDRYGLAASRPAPLVDLPRFAGDELDAARSGGDLCIQACGDDPQVLFHAIRNLTRIARGTAVLRWTQIGFGRTSSTTAEQETPRNLMGFKDGTNNLRAGSPETDEDVWVAVGDDPAWMRDGSYLVARRIRILVEVWDRSSLADQEATIGRVRSTGAPLGHRHERDPLDLAATDPEGELITPVDAHVRLANQEATGIHLLRRGYNFTDGVEPRVGQLDAGLFFLAYQRDPRAQFIPLQQGLATDTLNEYIRHVGSAVFAVPPGIQPGGWIGESLFEAAGQ